MAKTSLIVTSQNLDEGTSQQFTITDVNPKATDAELKTFAQMAVGLTEDTYVKTDRIDRRNLDTDSKPSRNPTFRSGSVVWDGSNPLRIPISAMWSGSNPQGQAVGINFTHQANPPTVCPICSLDNITNGITYTGYALSLTTAYPTQWQYQPRISEKAACSLTLHVEFAEGDGFQAYSVDVPIEIYDDSEG